ncbi:hypothetical protein EAW52_24985 [Pseudomonas sp. LTJR-52]|nr:hypothetical protein EAW52_24985 [Pseudomonas sp. LTJR-52]
MFQNPAELQEIVFLATRFGLETTKALTNLVMPLACMFITILKAGYAKSLFTHLAQAQVTSV